MTCDMYWEIVDALTDFPVIPSRNAQAKQTKTVVMTVGRVNGEVKRSKGN